MGHNAYSLQQLLVVPYSRGKRTQGSIPKLLWAIQMGHNAYGADKCASNVYTDDE